MGVAGATRCLTHFSGLGAKPGSPHQLPRSLGCVTPLTRCHSQDPALPPPQHSDTGPGLCRGYGQRQHHGAAAGTAVSSPLGSAPRSLRALHCPGPRLPHECDRGQQCPCGAMYPEDSGTVAGVPQCPRLRAAAAMPIVNGGLAATALSPVPQGEVY